MPEQINNNNNNNNIDHQNLTSTSQINDKNSSKTDNISQLKMMQKLMELITSLQEIQSAISGSSLEDLKLLATQSKSLLQLSRNEQQSQIDNDKNLSHKHGIMHFLGKVSKGLGCTLGIVLAVGAIAVAPENPALAVVLGIYAAQAFASSINSNYTINNGIDQLCGPYNGLATGLKLTALAGTAACGPEDPALYAMVLGSVMTSLNTLNDLSTLSLWACQTKGAKTFSGSQKKVQNCFWLQTCILVANMGIMIGTMFYGASNTAQEAKIAKAAKAAKEAKEAQEAKSGIEMEEFASGSSAATSATSVDTAADNLAEEDNIITKMAQKTKRAATNYPSLLESIILTITGALQAAQGGVSIAQGATTIQIGKIQETYANLQAGIINYNQSNDLVQSSTKTVGDFLHNMQDSYRQQNEQVINKILVDQTQFGQMLASIA